MRFKMEVQAAHYIARFATSDQLDEGKTQATRARVTASIPGICILLCCGALTLHRRNPDVWCHYHSNRCRYSPIRSDRSPKNAVGPEDRIKEANLIGLKSGQADFISG